VPGSPSPPPRQRPIGVFDSGVGGLTVLHELLVSLPHEDFVYLGDTGRFPYGIREPDELERFALQIAEHLLRLRTKLLVVACNTAAAAALPALQARMMETTLGVDVVAVVGPESQLAVEATRNGRIGLLATPATVASGAYHRAVAAADDMVELHAVPCPDLAPIITSSTPCARTATRCATPRSTRSSSAAPTTRSSRRCSSARLAAT
jgi:glutamate racemase